LIVGKTVTVGGTNQAVFGQEGLYTYNGGSPGQYRIEEGRICVAFATGRRRCDRIVQNAGRYFLINAQDRGFTFVPQ
jgi:hypothetical protein